MLDEIWHILTDPAHVFAELSWEIAFLILSFVLSEWRVRRAHRKHHEEKPAIPSDWKAQLQPPRRNRLDYEDSGFGLDEPIPYCLTNPPKEHDRG